MHLSLDHFCGVVSSLDKSNAEKALALLWFLDRKQTDIAKTAWELRRLMDDHHIGSPNPTFLTGAIRKTKLANESKVGFSLKPGSRKVIRDWLPDDLGGIQPTIDHNAGYLPEAVWKDTRGYVEAGCRELNGCFHSAYYNAAGVMLRRVLETLIIEAYERLKRESEIKDVAGNYHMLSDLVDRACGEKGHSGLNLGRDSKQALKDARNVGNWSAHARRYIAKAPDLTVLRQGVRVLTQELIHLAYDK